MKTALPVLQEQPAARCSGHCCRSFTMPQSPERLWEMYEDWRTTGPQDRLPLPWSNDIHIVAPMVKLLGETKVDPLDGRPFIDGKTKYLYTCKHHNPETGDCGIYEHRPAMCREYPNGYACRYEGCTAPPEPSAFSTRKLSEGAFETITGEKVRAEESESSIDWAVPSNGEEEKAEAKAE